MQAEFRRKEAEIQSVEVKVEKSITLPEREYQYFKKHLMKEYPFIRENLDSMYCEGELMHCLLVTGAESMDGVLVESEGAGYARYSAFVSDAAHFVGIRYQALEDMNTKLKEAVDSIIEAGKTKMKGSGIYIYSMEDITSKYGISQELFPLVVEMLCEREEVAEVLTEENETEILFEGGDYPQMSMT